MSLTDCLINCKNDSPFGFGKYLFGKIWWKWVYVVRKKVEGNR